MRVPLGLSVLLFSTLASAQSSTTITEFPNAPGNPLAITAGSDGALWFTGGQIGRITKSGTITTFPCTFSPGCSIQSYGITNGPDGALWFTGTSSNSIWRITTDGTLTDYPVSLPSASGRPYQIAAGSDGALWFTEGFVSPLQLTRYVLRMTTAGVVTSYTTSGVPGGIIRGLDDGIWFSEALYEGNTAPIVYGSKIGRIDVTTGALTEYPVAADFIANGPDGAMWFTSGSSFGRITTQGIVTMFPGPGAPITGLTSGPDGALWFTEASTNKIGRITTSGVITEYPLPTANSAPTAITAGPDGSLWFTEQYANQIGKIGPVATVPLLITSAPFLYGAQGVPYSQAFAAAGGTAPYTWSVLSGSLPAGFTLSTAGVLSGTPSVSATSFFTLQVQDAAAATDTLSFVLTVNAATCTYSFTNVTGGAAIGPFAFPPSGGGGAFIRIAAGLGCPWNVSGVPAWIATTMDSTGPVGSISGSGNGDLMLSALPNYGPDSRSGSITIQGTAFPVSQQAGLIPSAGMMPHLAAEGGWTTTFTLVNKGSFDAATQLTLLANNGSPLVVPFSFPQQPSTGSPEESLAASVIGPNASWIAQASGPDNVPFVEGSASMSSAGAVDGFAIFHYGPSGQEAVVPLNGSGYAIPFDNTNGVTTGIAVQSNVGGTFSLVILDDSGNVIGNGSESLTVPPNGHISFVLSDQFPVTANRRGVVGLGNCPLPPTPGGCVPLQSLGIRYTPPGTLTTIPSLSSPSGGVMPHIASGGGWQTTFVIPNISPRRLALPDDPIPTAHVGLRFFDDQGNPLNLPLTFPQTGASMTVSSFGQDIPPNSTLWIQTSGDVGTALLTGSAQLTGADGFAIFRYNPNGQEAVVPIQGAPGSLIGASVLAFDNTSSTATGVAISNGSSHSVAVPVTIRDDQGNQLGTSTIFLTANGHQSFMLATQYSVTAGIRGTLEFAIPGAGTANAATMGVLGIRSPPQLTFTTLPALPK
jgi:virginiamycin B lyase